jgi:hypothetical protein
MTGRARPSLREDAPLHLDLELGGLPLLDRVEFIQPLDEQ